MYDQNYAADTAQSTAAPGPASNQTQTRTATEGWLWRRAKVSFSKGWYRLVGGELICLGKDISSGQGEPLGKVSGYTVTSDEMLEFTICSPLARTQTRGPCHGPVEAET